MPIVVGSIQHESNTFCPNLAILSDFDRVYDRDMLTKIAPTAFFGSRGATLCPTLYANSVPSGAVERGSFDQLLGEMLRRFPRDGAIDGVWLYLHGAMEVEGLGSGDAAIVSAVRSRVGPEVPIAVALDFHANNAPDIARDANILCGYRTAPHTDMEETQMRAARCLLACIEEGLRPRAALVQVPIIITGDKVITAEEPMASIIAETVRLEGEPGILAASVFNGQPWVDAPNNGASAVVVAADEQSFPVAQAHARRLARMLWDARDQYRFQVDALEPADAVAAALASSETPVFISDSGDNTTAGALGNSAGLLGHLLDHGAKGALLAGLTDPAAVERCRNLAEGAPVELTLGGTLDTLAQGVKVQAVLRRHGSILGWDGEDAGEAVVLHTPGIDILVTARPCAVISPEIIASTGVRLEDYRIVVVKQGYLFPRLASRAGKAILALTPGVSCEAVEKIPFTRIRRPSWPMDGDFAWHP